MTGNRLSAAVAAGLFVVAVALLYPGIVTGAAVGDDAAILRVWPMTELNRTPPAHSNPFLFDATCVFHPDLEWVRSRVHDRRPPIGTRTTLPASRRSARSRRGRRAR